jgi:cation transport ATPase
MSNPAESMEQIEHHAHVASSFDRRVAMTVAILAALLATLHSIETDAQSESLKLEVESGKAKTTAADEWAFYQAKNQREHLYQSMQEMAQIVPTTGDAQTKKQAQERWQKQLDKYKKELPEHKRKAEEHEADSQDLHKKSDHEHELAISTGRGMLLLELGIVITSLAVLTKKRLFWWIGIVLGIAGVAYEASVFLPHLLKNHH